MLKASAKRLNTNQPYDLFKNAIKCRYLYKDDNQLSVPMLAGVKLYVKITPKIDCALWVIIEIIDQLRPV